MYTFAQEKVPQEAETLEQYVRRLRGAMGMSQQRLATTAGVHLQSLGKIERGQTTRLNQKTKQGLARVFDIPEEYLDAVCQGRPVEAVQFKRFCASCWTPGTEPDPMWLVNRAKFCLICGTQLQDKCLHCGEAIASFQHRFCPMCGTPYKKKKAV